MHRQFYKGASVIPIFITVTKTEGNTVRLNTLAIQSYEELKNGHTMIVMRGRSVEQYLTVVDSVDDLDTFFDKYDE